MKKLFGLVMLTIVHFFVFAQQKNESALIQAPVIRFFDAISDLNEEAIKAEVYHDFVLLEDGKIWNTDSLVRATLRYKGLDLKRVNQLDFFDTRREGNTAWVSYYNTADLSFKGKQISVKWLESAVLILRDGLWRMQLLHSTVIKPAAVMPKKN